MLDEWTPLAGGPGMPVAIVGIGCLLPGGADGPERLWANLVEGVSGIREVPAERWSLERYYHPEAGRPGRAITRWGGFVEGIGGFDAEAFGISPREALAMDPQQREALQVAWHALEDAGIAADRLAGSATGVFLGVCGSDYGALQRYRRNSDAVSNTGVAMSIVANRISHRLDLKGPSLVVDTACSSSLVAVHLACRALASGDCGLALAGGVNALLDPAPFVGFSQAGMMSPTGRMHMFDHRADGYVRAEGAVVLVLKPLEQAVRDDDRVYAVIRASWVNQDGHTATMTAPSAEAQAAMLRKAAALAGIDPASIAYVEAHGTGTPVGDPIEARAIGAAFGSGRHNSRRLLVGSVKTATGHLEAAAGAAGLAKTALVLRHRAVPANLNFERPNPAIPMDELGIAVPTAPTLLDGEGPLRAAVNSFGFGGTNACAILEEPPPAAPAAADPPPPRLVVPLSAATPSALASLAAALAERLRAEPGLAAHDVAWTLATRRARLAQGAAIVADGREQLVERLEALAAGEPPTGAGEAGPPPWVQGPRAAPPPLVLVFTGQGGQWWAMGRELMAADPLFRAEVERFDALFTPLAGWSVVEELGRPQAASRVDETEVAQPAIFALQIGLAARWRAFGIEPVAVLGHSFGEVAAAYVAGALSLEDAAALIFHRGRLQQSLEGTGAMAAVGLGVEEVRPWLAEPAFASVEVAAVNGPTMTTLGGPRPALEALLAALEARAPGTFARLLKLRSAYHTAGMEPIKESFHAALAGLRAGPARLPMISTVTGAPIPGEALDAAYWWRNVREPVLFQPAVEQALAHGWTGFLELGPHVTLAGPLNACLAHRGVQGLVLSSLHREQAELDTLWAAAAALWVRGLPLDWQGVLGRGRRFVDLPRYPFEKQRFWAPCEEARAMLLTAPVHPLLGERLPGPQPRWRGELDLASLPFLKDHRVDGSILLPGAAYLEMMLAAAGDALGPGPVELEAVRLHEGLFLDPERSELVETVLDPERGRITIHSRTRDGAPDWVLRASGRVRVRPMAVPAPAEEPPVEAAPATFEADGFYARAAERRYEYGPLFQGVARIWTTGRGARGTVVRPAGLEAGPAWRFHPALLDGCLQVGLGPLLGREAGSELHLPQGFARVRWFDAPGACLEVAVHGTRVDARSSSSDLLVRDADGRALLVIEGFETRRLPVRARRSEEARRAAFYREVWQEAALEATAGDPAAAATVAPPGEPGAWLLLADRQGLARALAERLRGHGHRCLLVRPGEAYVRRSPDEVLIRPGAAEDLALLAQELAGGPSPWRGVIHAWALHAPDLGTDPGPSELLAFQAIACLPALQLVQELARRPELAPRLWLLTRGGRRIGDPTLDRPAGAHEPSQAPLLGLARTIASEHEALRCCAVDLDLDEPGLEPLWAELVADTAEPEIAIRGGRRFVNRLERAEPAALPARRLPARDPAIAGWKLAMPAPGVLDTMRIAERPCPEPGPGEVLVEVAAVALNFRDIMAATGLLPEEAEPDPPVEALGTECAGTVVAVGPGVEGLSPGDRVASMARGSFASHVRMPAAMALKVPDGLSLAEASTVPVAFLTAWYALVTLGRMQPGERVLIHVATGGVGLAAIQIARMVGAEIFATAGSEAKRAYLRELGIRHVMSSRSLDFADEILAATGGRGVDLVLNSLPGAALEKSLEVLAPHGRFLELGKRDIYGDTPLGLKVLRRNIAFFAIDLASIDPAQAGQIRAVLDELEALLAAGRIRPLPTETFPVSKVVDAFRHMSQAKHIGKVVVDLADPALEVALDPDRPLRLAADASYLVTGGLGGFGLEVARFLARAGAGQLVLVGRSGASSEAARAVVAELEAAGTRVLVVQADVTRMEDVRRVLDEVAASGRPLKGVVHGAMVLDDGFITQLDWARFQRALAPKLVGAWNLHRATLDLPLDHFVMFSSVAALLGSKGQANYVAGNAFLDALARYRRARGLPALTVNWGALGEVGFVARTEAMARYLESSGIGLVPLADSLGALGRLLRQDPGAVGFAAIAWDTLLQVGGAGAPSPRLAHLASAGEAGGGRLKAELLAAPAERRGAMVARFLRQQIAKVLRVEEAKIGGERPLSEVGLDSLTAFELKNRIEGELALSLPVQKLLQQPTLASLTEAVLERLGEEGGVEAAGEAGGEPPLEGTPTGGAALLSNAQEWLASLFAPGHELTAEHRNFMLTFGLSIRPRLDLDRLGAAFESTVARHAMLRASLPLVDGRPSLAIAPKHPRGIEVVDATGLVEAELDTRVRSIAGEPFDLAQGPLFRLIVLRCADDRDVLLLRAFHAVIDGWSTMLLVMELFGRYFGLADPDLVSDQPPAAYTEFARWQRAMMAGPEGAALRAYWEGRLAGIGPRLALPFDRPRQPGPVREAGAIRFVLDRPLSARVEALAAATGGTPYVVLLAAFDALILGLTGETDLPVNVAAAGRSGPQFTRTVGWFGNRLIVRHRIAPERSFAELVRHLHGRLTEDLAHQDYPLRAVADRLATTEDGLPSRLGQLTFSMVRPDHFDDRGFAPLLMEVADARLNFGSLEVTSFPVKDRGVVGDLDFREIEADGRFHFDVRYNADCFDHATAERICSAYRQLLAQALAEPEQPVAVLAGACGFAAAGATDAAALSAAEAMLLGRIDRSGARDAWTRHFEYAYCLAVEPPLDLQRLGRAFDRVTGRHEILRTVYPRGPAGRTPLVLPAHPTGLEIVELADRPAGEVAAIVQARADEAYDVDRGPLFQVVAHRAQGRDLLLFRLHHLVYDSWSLLLLLNEMFETYFGLRAAEPPPRFQYRDFARWQRAYIESAEGRAELAYWAERLADPGPPLDLPFYRRAGGDTIAHGRTVRFVLEPEATAPVLQLAQRLRTSGYAILHAAFKLLLCGYTGRRDLLVDATMAARVRPELETVVGWLNANRPIRDRLLPEQSFAALVGQVTRSVRAALEHQAVPLQVILARLGLDPEVRPSQLGQVAFLAMRPDRADERGLGALLVNRPDANLRFGSIEVRAVPLDRDHCERDLAIYVQEVEGRTYGELILDADRCALADAERVVADFRALLAAATLAPDEPLTRILGRVDLGFGTGLAQHAAE